jgi:hypothetical protein
MIDKALECIQRDLNAQLGGRDTQLPHVTLGHLVAPDGAAGHDSGGVVMLLTAIDEERNVGNTNQMELRNGTLIRSNERAFVNLHVMFAATQSTYTAALASLGAVVGYLKGKSVFDARNTAKFPSELGQLTLTMEKLDYAGLSNLWSYIGTSYVPSANYTVRMVSLGHSQARAMVPPIEQVEIRSSAS